MCMRDIGQVKLSNERLAEDSKPRDGESCYKFHAGAAGSGSVIEARTELNSCCRSHRGDVNLITPGKTKKKTTG